MVNAGMGGYQGMPLCHYFSFKAASLLYPVGPRKLLEVSSGKRDIWSHTPSNVPMGLLEFVTAKLLVQTWEALCWVYEPDPEHRILRPVLIPIQAGSSLFCSSPPRKIIPIFPNPPHTPVYWPLLHSQLGLPHQHWWGSAGLPTSAPYMLYGRLVMTWW